MSHLCFVSLSDNIFDVPSVPEWQSRILSLRSVSEQSSKWSFVNETNANCSLFQNVLYIPNVFHNSDGLSLVLEVQEQFEPMILLLTNVKISASMTLLQEKANTFLTCRLMSFSYERIYTYGSDQVLLQLPDGLQDALEQNIQYSLSNALKKSLYSNLRQHQAN